MNLFDPPQPAVRDSPTSVAAGESMAGSAAATLRASILDHIRYFGGATCDECERELDLRHQTASARIFELRKAGFIVDSGHTRKTRSGRSAVVWIAKGE